MNRKVKSLEAVEFNEAYLVLANHADVGWACVKICGDRDEAVEKMKDLCPSEFEEDEVAIRSVSLLNGDDILFSEAKNRSWFDDCDE